MPIICRFMLSGLCFLPLTPVSELPDRQTSIEVPAQFEFAEEFVRLLEGTGIIVREISDSRWIALFDHASGARAAYIRTNLGVVELIALNEPGLAERITITYRRESNRHLYELEGPSVVEGCQIDGTQRFFFTLHDQWFILVWEATLEDQMERMLRQRKRFRE